MSLILTAGTGNGSVESKEKWLTDNQREAEAISMLYRLDWDEIKRSCSTGTFAFEGSPTIYQNSTLFRLPYFGPNPLIV